MAVQQAIKIQSKGVARVVNNAAIPAVRDDCMLVEIDCVGLNPTDWKHTAFFPTKDATVGCDYAGIVEQVGKDVTDFKVGDRVFGWCHGSNNQNLADGSFARHAEVWPGAAMKLPDRNLTMEQAATLGVGLTTIGQTLYQSLSIPLPGETGAQDEPILIYGGSTAVGALAIQFAKLSGMKVITTCSPQNFGLVRRLGADVVVDYNATSAIDEIRNATTNDQPLLKVLDCISEPATGTFCGKVIAHDTAGGHYVCLNPVTTLKRPDVKQTLRLAYSCFGRPMQIMRKDYPASMEDRDYATKFIREIAVPLIADGKVHTHPVSIRAGGLEGVLQGLNELKQGSVSGTKLVYMVKI